MSVISIDDTGVIRQQMTAIVANLTTRVQTIFNDADLAPATPEARLLAVFAQAADELTDLVEDVWRQRSPSVAAGPALSRLVAINGIERKPATFSTAPMTLGGVVGTQIPTGSLVDSMQAPPTHWATVADYTIGPGGTVAGQVVASLTGPVAAMAGQITDIKTVISGWDSAINTADATPGRNLETDLELRIRRVRSVAISAIGTTDSLRAALLSVAGVVSADVQENVLDVGDGRGLPPHSVRVIVAGGLDADIAQAIVLKRGQGCTLVGASSLDVRTAQGRVETVRWDRPTQIAIYATVVLSRAVSTETKNQIAAAMVDLGNGDEVSGASVVWSGLFAPVLGVIGTGDDTLTIVSIFLGTALSPTVQADVAIASTEIASWDAGRISVLP